MKNENVRLYRDRVQMRSAVNFIIFRVRHAGSESIAFNRRAGRCMTSWEKQRIQTEIFVIKG